MTRQSISTHSRKKWCEPVAKPRRSCRILKGTMTIKKICFSPKVSIQPCRPNSDSAPPVAIWAQFKHWKQVKASPHQGTRLVRWWWRVNGACGNISWSRSFHDFCSLLSVRLRIKCRFFFVKRRPTAKNRTPAHKSDSTTTPARQSTFNNTFGQSSAPPNTQKTEIQAKCRTCYVTNLMLIRKIYQWSLYCLSHVKFDVRPWPKVIRYINS